MIKMDTRTEDLAAIALTKECWSLDDWDIDLMRKEEKFDTAKDELIAAETMEELHEVEIDEVFEVDEVNELNVLKQRRVGEFEAIVVEERIRGRSDQERFAVALEGMMTPEQRYQMSELIELIDNRDFEFTENDEAEIPSEPGRPRWNRTIRNAVRNSPDRTGHAQDWWGALRAEKQDGTWYYWIEEDEEE
jgi:hypothetical protein